MRVAQIPRGCTREIIVIDDGSDDGTVQFLNTYGAGIKVLRNECNRGKGAAIRAAFEVATGDVVLIQDGDLEYDPNDYAALLAPILQSEADVVYGSRFLGSAHGMRWPNRAGNFVLTAATNLLYRSKLSDQATGYKVLRADLLKRLAIQADGFEFCSELTAKILRAGLRIHEVAITYHARTVADGKKVRAKDAFKALLTLMKFRFIPLTRIRGEAGTSAAIPVCADRETVV